MSDAELIYYRGLNCRLAGIINIAALLGVNYLDAYSALWSETDFSYEEQYGLCASKRVYAGLEAIGVMTEALDCGEMKAAGSIEQIADGELFLTGADIFYLPWHPVFNHFRDRHYFFARKETADSVSCFDPVYNKKDITMKSADILTSAFELSRVYKLDVSPPEYGPQQEAKAVLRSHPETREKLLAEILNCKSEGRNYINALTRQITAMINNRYLFRHYLNGYAPVSGGGPFFSQTFLLKWEAVKNGLYKAAIVKDNITVVGEVYTLFGSLMQEETAMAEEIIREPLFATPLST